MSKNKSAFRIFLALYCFVIAATQCLAQSEAADIIWAKAISGSREFDSERGISTATDKNGNIFVAGLYAGELNFGSVTLPASPESHFVAKYTDSGDLLWAQYIRTGDLVGVATDGAGNCYVAGEFSQNAWIANTNLTSEFSATFVAALSGDGDFLWARTVNVSECYRIAANDNGNVTIAGMLLGAAQFGSITLSNSTYSMYISRLNTQGTFQWAVKGGTYGLLEDLAVDESGNSYIAGGFWANITFGSTTLSSVGGSDMFIAKYNTTGNLVWARRYGSTFDRGAGSPSDVATALAVDRLGNIYFTGYYGGNWTFTSNIGGFYPTMLVAKLDALGNPVWGRPAYTSGFDLFPKDLALDARGNIYIAGLFSSDVTFDHSFILYGNFENLFLAKYANNGQFLAAHRGYSFASVKPASVAVDIFGGAHVTGEFAENVEFEEFTVQAPGQSTFLYKAAFTGSTTPPVITANPKDMRLVIGGSGTLSVSAASAAAVTYQWHFNGTNLPGATAASLNISGMNSNRVGPYRVRVANSAGSLTSAVANVGIAFAPTILTHPVTQTLTPGSNITFSVAAAGTAPLSYRWLRDGFSVPGGTGPVLSLTHLQPAQAGAYRVIVTNAWGSVTSLVARLDQVPHLQFRSPTYVVGENAGTIAIPVMRANRTSGPVSISFSTAAGNAFGGVDYADVSGTLSWADGDAADKLIQFSIINDIEAEDNENFVLTLFGATSDAVPGVPAVVSIVILDDESPAKIGFELSQINVNEAVGSAEARVIRSGGAGQSHFVHFETLNGTAVAGSDYASRSGLLSIAANEAVKSIFVPIVDDWPIEGIENFSLRLSGPSGGLTIVNSNTTVAIEDNEYSFSDRYGHGLLIADFELISYEIFSSTITGTFTITNGSTSASVAGMLQLSGTDPFASDPTNYLFSAIPAYSAIRIDITATGRYIFENTNTLYATVFEQTVTGLTQQDRRAFFQIFGTAPPSGGVPTGCCITTGNPSPGLPYVTNVIILGPDALNEATSGQYSARVVLSNGQTNNSPAISWGASTFAISASGLLATPHLSSNVTVYVRATNVFNGVTQVATKEVTVRDLRVRLADPRLVSGNRYRVTLSGPANRAYDIQESIRLTDWTNVARVTNISGNLAWTNPPTTGANQRFYRARER